MKRTEAIAVAVELLDWLRHSGVMPPAGSLEAVQMLIASAEEKASRGVVGKLKGYAPKTRKRIASHAASSRWAGMTKQERSAEMSRRRRKGVAKAKRPAR